MCFRIQAFCFVMTKIIFYVEKHELFVLANNCVLLRHSCVWFNVNLVALQRQSFSHKDGTRDRYVDIFMYVNYSITPRWIYALVRLQWLNEWASRCFSCSSFRHIHHVLNSPCSWQSRKLLFSIINVNYLHSRWRCCSLHARLTNGDRSLV